MKKLFAILMMIGLLVGCAEFQMGEDANSQAMAYIAGKGMAIGIYEIYPKAAPSIEQAWMDMMGRNYGKPEIPAVEMVNFFNGVVLKQVPTLKNDKYGFSGDLKYFLQLYGAQYTPDGVLTGLKPVPMIVAQAFQIGYEGGRSVAIKK